MNLEEQTLAKAYAVWQMSQRCLAAAQASVDLPAADVAVALENALMGLTIVFPGKGAGDLFPNLTAKGVLEGFAFTPSKTVAKTNHAEAIASAVSAVVSSTSFDNMADVTAVMTDDTLTVGDFSEKVVTPIKRLYAAACKWHGEADAVSYVARSALAYASLYASTRHIGPPQGVYDDFHAWGVRNEGFASPFNSRLLDRPSSGYFSALPATDGPLGSRGNFFDANPKDHDGAWCVDPPFIPEVMAKVDAKLRQWRAMENGPSVLLIVPTSHNVDAPVDETVVLSKGVHHYTGLDGELHPLPVDVAIHRLGPLDGWDAEKIKNGYLPKTAVVS